MAATPTAAAASSIMGTRVVPDIRSGSGRITARFGFGKKKAAPKKTKTTVTTDRPLWYPGAKSPEWLDGSLVGDYGFDPFGLGKPAEYLQFDIDSLDQNLAKNLAGDAWTDWLSYEPHQPLQKAGNSITITTQSVFYLLRSRKSNTAGDGRYSHRLRCFVHHGYSGGSRYPLRLGSVHSSFWVREEEGSSQKDQDYRDYGQASVVPRRQIS
ncbi:hypothetical protein F2Q70_00013959 [Brassica cretica]|uniref:Chlorophyll a-b binding protein, chloroplastic n=1 Tax=Brassica cretica TaxID=69181 RepID=A0A8S9HZ76_BRACR|nr:hypothetical protein F2Q70_00013959 [Brassica cretica]